MRFPLHFTCSIGTLQFKLVTIAENRLEDEIRSFQHQHFGHELHYLFEGSCDLSCDNQTYQMHEGDIVLIPRGVYHRFFNQSHNIRKLNIEFEALTTSENAHHPKEVLICEALARSDIQFIDVLTCSNQSLYTSFSLLSDTLNSEKDTFIFQELLRAQAVFALTYLFSELTEATHSSGALPNVDISRHDIIDNFFNTQYENNSFENLTRKLSLSHRQLGRIVQRSYGKSLREKRNEIRLENAMDLLQNTQKSIADIADILGYSSPSSFSAFLKRETNKSPSEIRKST